MLRRTESSVQRKTQGANTCAACLDSQPKAALPKHDPICHYCIVRTDIPVGLAFAQLLHAAGESSDGKLTPGTYAVALAADSQLELERIARHLEQHGIPFHRVVESHGKYAGQLMALGVMPGPKSIRGQYLSNVPLLKLCCFSEYEGELSAAYESAQLHRETIRKLERELAETRKPWWKRWVGK